MQFRFLLIDNQCPKESYPYWGEIKEVQVRKIVYTPDKSYYRIMGVSWNDRVQ